MEEHHDIAQNARESLQDTGNPSTTNPKQCVSAMAMWNIEHLAFRSE